MRPVIIVGGFLSGVLAANHHLVTALIVGAIILAIVAGRAIDIHNEHRQK